MTLYTAYQYRDDLRIFDHHIDGVTSSDIEDEVLIPLDLQSEDNATDNSLTDDEYDFNKVGRDINNCIYFRAP